MNIAVNTRLLLKDKLEGIGTFAFESLRRITGKHKEHNFIYLFDRPFSEEFITSSNITPVVVPPPTRHPLLWYWWLEKKLPAVLKQHKADIFFSPDGFIPLNLSIPSHTVIHDLNFEHYPADLPWSARKYYRHFFPRFAAKANRIATVSEYSKKDISSLYHVDPQKIDVVYNGSVTEFSPLSEEEKTATRNEYSGGQEYFVYVGSLHPRKNIPRLLQAYEEFRKHSGKRVKLLLIGSKASWAPQNEEQVRKMKFGGDVHFTGRMGVKKLRYLLGSALALTYVPYFEGFGIPIVEAMSAGVPVICSNKSSMPEVAGDAALLIDPFFIGSITEAMLNMAGDEALREKLITKGHKQAEKFSWERTASLLWESILRAK
jgi:glycosyltransferase involved in cell wall biosynthesis